MDGRGITPASAFTAQMNFPPSRALYVNLPGTSSAAAPWLLCSTFAPSVLPSIQAPSKPHPTH